MQTGVCGLEVEDGRNPYVLLFPVGDDFASLSLASARGTVVAHAGRHLAHVVGAQLVGAI